MKLKLLLTAAIMTVATAVSVSAMTDFSGNEVYGDKTEGVKLSTTSEDQTSMLAVSINNTIKIDVTGVVGNLTLLSYKNKVDPSPDNIQYIRQYTPDENGNITVTFQIREILSGNGTNQENGLYCVKLNDGNGDVKTLYYKVGEPVSETEAEKTYHQLVEFSKDDNSKTVSVGYKATFTLNGGCVNKYGFIVTYDNGSPVEQSGTTELSGSGEFSFGVTVYDIPEDTNVDLIKAVPFVNYVENNTATETVVE